MTVYSINGKIVEEGGAFISPESRAYRYGDGFFESMKLSRKILLHSDLHFIRIRKSAMLLKMQLPEGFDQEKLEQWIGEAADTLGTENARVRCTVFRDSAGLYAPIDNSCSVVLEVNKTDDSGYLWNEKGLILGSYKELSKNANFTSTLKTTSALTYVMASIYARENGYDDCVLFNDLGRVTESISSNIFVVQGEFINTPPLAEYCVDGVMRRVVIQRAEAYGFTVQEQPISEISLNSAEEIFLSSAVRGIRWVGEFEGKKYRNATAKALHGLINKGLNPE
jgi:branched-chain amino acid aminotransferase